MSQYTPEELEAVALRLAGGSASTQDEIIAADVTRTYAATLRQAARVDEGSLASRIGKDLQNPRFWLDALATATHTTDCAEKVRALENAHHWLSKFVEAALSAQPATVRCEPCGGMGNIMDMRCIGCNGTGRVSAQPAQGECPKHGDTHEDCGGQWCDYVQPEYKPSAARSFSPGESSIARYVRIGMICDKCGKEHPASPTPDKEG